MARSPSTAGDLDAMRAAAWHRDGIAALPIQDIVDPWLRQAITNEANRRWGRRQGDTAMAGKRKTSRGNAAKVPG